VWHPMKIHKRQRFPDLSLVRRHGWTCARGVSFSSTFAATLTPVRRPPAWRQIGSSRTSRPHLSAAHCLGQRPLPLPAPPSLSLLRALSLQHRLFLRCSSGRRAACLCCTALPRDNGALWGVAGGLGGSTFAADRHHSAPCAKFDAGMRGSASPLRRNRWLSWYPPLLPRRIVLCHPVAFSFATPSHSPLPPRRILLCHPVAFSFATPSHSPLPPRRILLCHPVAFSFATPSHSPLPPRRILLCHPVAFSSATPSHSLLLPRRILFCRRSRE